MSKIIRSKRNTPFVQIDKTGPEDPNLSWKAKGILAYILCKPDDWQVYISEITKHSKDGKESTRTGVKELIDAGYIIRERKHDEGGKFLGYDYQVFERPTVIRKSENGSTVIRFSENGKSVNGLSENGKSATTNNNLTNKESTNNKVSECAREKNEENQIEENTQLTDEFPPSKKIAAKKVSHDRPPHELDAHLTEEIPDFNDTPDWTEIATEMAQYFREDGARQWQFMCDAAGGWVDPLVITTAWAGKNCDSAYLLKNWRKQTGKLTNWIKNNLRADDHQAKLKNLNNGKGNKQQAITTDTLEEAYRLAMAEGYR